MNFLEMCLFVHNVIGQGDSNEHLSNDIITKQWNIPLLQVSKEGALLKIQRYYERCGKGVLRTLV